MTDKVAFLAEGQFIYWRSIIIAAAALTALLAAVAVRLWQKKSLVSLLIALPVAIIFSVMCARFIDWYCRFESYESFGAAMSTLTGGGYSLIGVFIGTIAACSLMRLLRVTDDLPALLDSLSPAAALGIAVGRFSELFSAADRGKFPVENPSLQRLPIGSAVTNSISGAVEWRFATFCAQGIWCALLLLILAAYWAVVRRRKSGDVFLLFMLLYCLGQILLDSTRYDALFLRTNGFVSLEQIVCAVTVAAILTLWSVKTIRAGGFRSFLVLLWVLALLGLGLVGGAEWFVQRKRDQFALAYSAMALGLFMVFTAGTLLKRSAKRAEMSPPETPDTGPHTEEDHDAEQLETLSGGAAQDLPGEHGGFLQDGGPGPSR